MVFVSSLLNVSTLLFVVHVNAFCTNTGARKKRRRGESYIGFFFRNLSRRKRSKRKRKGPKDLEESMLPESSSRRSKSSSRRRASSRSVGKSRRSSSASRRHESFTKTTVQPGSDRRPSRSQSRSRVPSSAGSVQSQRSGVFDLTTSTPQDHTNDKRQQLV